MTKIKISTLEALHKAVSSTKKVHWSNELYDVVWDKVCKEYLVICKSNGYTTGLDREDFKSLFYYTKEEN